MGLDLVTQFHALGQAVQYPEASASTAVKWDSNTTYSSLPQVCSAVFWNTEAHLALATLTNKLKPSVSIEAFGRFESIP